MKSVTEASRPWKRAVQVAQLLLLLCICTGRCLEAKPQGPPVVKCSSADTASKGAARAEYAYDEAKPLQMLVAVSDTGRRFLEEGSQAAQKLPKVDHRPASPSQAAEGQIVHSNAQKFKGNPRELNLASQANASFPEAQSDLHRLSGTLRENQTLQLLVANSSSLWSDSMTHVNLSKALQNVTESFTPPSSNIFNATVNSMKTVYRSYIDALGHMDCIGNAELDVELTYTGVNRSSEHVLMSSCEQSGLLHERLCTKSEVLLYLQTLGESLVGPTLNCQEFPGRHLRGCYPGFASFAVQDPASLDFHTKEGNPWRTDRDLSVDQLACCPGFFCPEGLACMIPCPRGSFCPRASLLKGAYGLCEPYKYHAYEGVCGGADAWGVAMSHDHDKIFCWDGFYCPTTTDWPVRCPPGHYCPRGSQTPKKCGRFQICGPRSGDVDARELATWLTCGGLLLLYALLRGADHVWRCRCDQANTSKSLPKVKSLLRRAISLMTSKEKCRGVRRQSNGMSPFEVVVKDQEFSNPLPNNLRSSSKLLEDTPGPAGPEFVDTGTDTDPGSEYWQEKEVLLGEDGDNNTKPSGLKRRISSNVVEGTPGVVGAVRSNSVALRKSGGVDQSDLTPLLPNGVAKSLGDQLGEGDSDVSPSEVFWRGQPRVEVEMSNLAMVLPGGKEVMAGVNGRLRAGRLTAIMGPSGAGKSLLLHALAGKETYCHVRGGIRINGQHRTPALRKISGFVPQDDVVHATLTVEENIWFSAAYRLPSHASRRRRGKIVEHVLSALGLQNVRHSLVGSVERRGISGGQRKRVSVGLEMVAQPSLLLLDEPTSGLDSVSSLQMLTALKEETRAGLNAAAVIHQPSYELLSIFDDVLLLNEGLVFLGPMSEVEPYFDGLGFPVPNRMNPADHFMNIMSQLVESTRGIQPGDLPQLWGKHREALEASREATDALSIGPPCDSKGAEPPGKSRRGLLDKILSVVKEGLKVARGLRQRVGEREVTRRSWRTTPGVWRQFVLILLRLWKQQVREHNQLMQDYLIVATVAVFMGMILQYSDAYLGGSTLIQESILALSLISNLGVLRTFGADKLHFWRESASGVNRLSYFLAKDTSDHIHTVCKSLVYMSIFYFSKNMRSTYHDNITVTLALSYCCTGLGYLLSIVFKPSSAQLSAAMTALLALLLGGRENPRGTTGVLARASYAYYAGKAFFVSNAKRYSGVWLLTRCALMEKAGFKMSDYGYSIIILVIYGLLARAVAFIALVLFDRDKQA